MKLYHVPHVTFIRWSEPFRFVSRVTWDERTRGVHASKWTLLIGRVA